MKRATIKALLTDAGKLLIVVALGVAVAGLVCEHLIDPQMKRPAPVYLTIDPEP